MNTFVMFIIGLMVASFVAIIFVNLIARITVNRKASEFFENNGYTVTEHYNNVYVDEQKNALMLYDQDANSNHIISMNNIKEIHLYLDGRTLECGAEEIKKRYTFPYNVSRLSIQMILNDDYIVDVCLREYKIFYDIDDVAIACTYAWSIINYIVIKCKKAGNDGVVFYKYELEDYFEEE